MFPDFEDSASVVVLADKGDHEAIRRGLLGVLFGSYVDNIRFLTPIEGISNIKQQASVYKALLGTVPTASESHVVIYLQSSSKAARYESWSRQERHFWHVEASPEAVVRTVLKTSPEKMRFSFWRNTLNSLLSRTVSDPVPWLEQFGQLGCREVGEHLLYSIIVIPVQTVYERVVLTELELHNHGVIPCYVVIDSNKPDSDKALYWWISRLQKPVVALFQDRDLAVLRQGEETVTKERAAEYVTAADEKIARAADILVLVDECNFTGEKFFRTQVSRIRDLATTLGKQYLVKYAYSTTCGLPENSGYKYRLETMPDVKDRFVVPKANNVIHDVSPEHPMAFRHIADSTQRAKLLEICGVLGRQLRPDHPLGFGNMAATLLFDNVPPDNTVPLLTYFGKVTYQGKTIPWKPLFDSTRK